MVEWQARAAHGWDHDTWHGGKFIAAWADAPVYAAFAQSFALTGLADGWRAMQARLNLFHQLARDLARRQGFDYPLALEQRILDCVRDTYNAGGKSGFDGQAET